MTGMPRAVADEIQSAGETGNRTSIRQIQRTAACDGHHAEGCDKGWQVHAGDEQTVDEAADAANQHTQQERRRKRYVALEHGAEQNACKRQHRADRKVNAARQDDESHAAGECRIDLPAKRC